MMARIVLSPIADANMLAEALEALERVGCQFWACDGPSLEPVDMKTCHVCRLTARLQQRLGRPIGEPS